MPIGLNAKAMLFATTIMKWQTNSAEGWGRVLDTTGGTSYVLNTNRLDGIQNKNTGALTRSSFYYFDNPFDRKDNSHYVVCNDSVADIITHMDQVSVHEFIPLEIFPNMNHLETPITTVIPMANFAFARAVDDAHTATQSYVWYTDASFKFVRCRVNQSLVQLMAMVV